jgi:hypothetical protein
MFIGRKKIDRAFFSKFVAETQQVGFALHSVYKRRSASNTCAVLVIFTNSENLLLEPQGTFKKSEIYIT